MSSTGALLERIEEEAGAYLSAHDEATVVLGLTVQGERHVVSLRSPGAGVAPVPTAQHVYEIGSISKTFTTIVLAVLEDRGLLSIEDPISAHLPADLTLRPEIGSITIRQLATHSAGLPSVGPIHTRMIAEETRGSEPPFGAYTHYLRYRREHLYADLEDVELAYPTGEGWLYSILGMGTVGHILELVTDTPYEQLLREVVCVPLGLEDTGYTLSFDQLGRMMFAYDAEGQPLPNWYHDVLLPQGGLRSTMDDLLTFAEANLRASIDDEDTELARAMRRASAAHLAMPKGRHTPDVLSRPWTTEVLHGLAWRRHEHEGGPVTWHPGTTLFYHCGLGVDPQAEVGCALMTSDRKTLRHMDELNQLFLDWFARACDGADA